MPRPQLIASITNWHRKIYLRETLAVLNDIEHQGIELQARGVDSWIRYRVLEKLNAFNEYRPDSLPVLREVLAPLRAAGKRVGMWVHDLWIPHQVLDLYPELRTPRGDIDLSNPLLEQFITDRLEQFFTLAPEFDYIVLTLTETTYPVMQRFDNRKSPLECTRWLFGLYDRVCRAHRVELVVRPFSAKVPDYDVVREALASFPEIPVMLKSEPFDWDPFLPLEVHFKDFPDRLKVMEFDISAEYYGCNHVPAVILDYVRERLEYGLSLGVQRFVGRIERYGRNTLRGINRGNGIYTGRFFQMTPTQRQPRRFLHEFVASEYPRAANAADLADALEHSFDIIKHVFYIDGQLLFHGLYCGLQPALNAMIFETARPNHPLAHLKDEWPMLYERTTPTAETIRAEKVDAVREAERLLAQVRRAADAYPEIIEAFETLWLLARVMDRIVLAVQTYLAKIGSHVISGDGLEAVLIGLRTLAVELRQRRGEQWLHPRIRGGMPAALDRFADDLGQTFATERILIERYPLGQDSREDVILCGFPNEGHCPSKPTHGAGAYWHEGRWHRRVTDSLAYTSRLMPGRKKILAEVYGHGRFHIGHQASREFQAAQWTTLELDVETTDGMLTFTTQRVGTPPPSIRLIEVKAMA